MVFFFLQREADLVNHRFQTDLSGTPTHGKRADTSPPDEQGTAVHEKKNGAAQSTSLEGQGKNVKKLKQDTLNNDGPVSHIKLSSSNRITTHDASEGKDRSADKGGINSKVDDHLSNPAQESLA